MKYGYKTVTKTIETVEPIIIPENYMLLPFGSPLQKGDKVYNTSLNKWQDTLAPIDDFDAVGSGGRNGTAYIRLIIRKYPKF